MVCTAIIPDGQIVPVPPPVPALDVVVPDDEVEEPVQQFGGFVFRQIVDLLHVVAKGEEGLPSRDRVRSNHGVDGT